MSHIQGAVVVRRPDLATTPGMLAPANSLDFGKTLESYASIFRDSLFPYRYVAVTWATQPTIQRLLQEKPTPSLNVC